MAILCLIYKQKERKLSVLEYEIGKKPDFNSMKVTVFMSAIIRFISQYIYIYIYKQFNYKWNNSTINACAVIFKLILVFPVRNVKLLIVLYYYHIIDAIFLSICFCFYYFLELTGRRPH